MGVNIFSGISRGLHNRFIALSWPTDYFPALVESNKDKKYMSLKASSKAYPIRGVRYWMTRELIRNEVELIKKNTSREEVTIVELGCNRGNVKGYTGELGDKVRWIGLDWDTEFKGEALSAGYSEFIESDFDKTLPLEDQIADIVVIIHVVEHLPRPEFTLAEIERILKPGGLLVAGTPITPRPISLVHDWNFKRKLKAGKIKTGGHIQALSCPRWKKLLKNCELTPEFFSGAFLLRYSGSPLENYAWWFRLNVAWGALFPFWGNELYLGARKKSA
jgi:SAM-dependent methyltransferase